MLRLTVNTKKTPAEVMREARHEFVDGLGLDAEEANLGITFSGAGGYVTLAFDAADGETVVDISTREFEEPARKFARTIG